MYFISDYIAEKYFKDTFYDIVINIWGERFEDIFKRNYNFYDTVEEITNLSLCECLEFFEDFFKEDHLSNDILKDIKNEILESSAIYKIICEIIFLLKREEKSLLTESGVLDKNGQLIK